MTAYFDTKADALQALHHALTGFNADEVAGVLINETRFLDRTRELENLERVLVRDVTVCVEWPGCPEDIRDAVHEVVLRHGGPEALPAGAIGRDYATFAAHAAGLLDMCVDLHGVFHELALRRIEPFTDSPITPISALAGAGDARRETMVPPPVAVWRAQLAEPNGLTPEERGAALAVMFDRAVAYATDRLKLSPKKVLEYAIKVREDVGA